MAKYKRKPNKKMKCPLCDERYRSVDGLYEHLEDEHDDEIPEDFTPARYMYYIKTGKVSGTCVVDKSPTDWNETTGKYNRFCNNPKCKEKYREEFKKRMINKYGKVSLLKDPEQQKKMLAHRKISGEYIWTDGTKMTYTGSYEKEFLQFLDAFMNFDSSDVMAPSPHTYYYKYEGEELFYIPDFYIPSLNLEIEVKDGGDNPNMHGKIQAVDKVKEKLKDEVMYAQKDRDYIKIVNKNYDNFFEYLLGKKEDIINERKTAVEVHPVDESFIPESESVLNEGLLNFNSKGLYFVSENKNQNFNSSTVFAKTKREALYWYLNNSSIKYKEVKKSRPNASWFEDTNELIVNMNYNKLLDKNIYIFRANRSSFGSDINYGARIEKMDKFKILDTEETTVRELISNVGIKLTIPTVDPSEIGKRRAIIMALRNRVQLTLNKPEFEKFKSTKSLYLDIPSKDSNIFINSDSDDLTFIRYDANKFYNGKARYYYNEDGAKEYSSLVKKFMNEILSDKKLSGVSIFSGGDWDGGYYNISLNSKTKSEFDMTKESYTDDILEESSFMNNLEFNTPELLFRWMHSNLKYDSSSNWKLKSAQEVYDTKMGNCHDQAWFASKVLTHMHKPNGMLFFVEYNENESSGGRTHTLVWFNTRGKIYWLENAWGGQKGIHGPFDSTSDLKKHIEEIHSKEPQAKRYPLIQWSTPKKLKSGLDLGKYVEYALE